MKRFLNTLPAFLVLFIGIIVSFWIQRYQNEAQLNLKTNDIKFIVDNDTKIIQQGLRESFSTIEILKNLFEKQEEITQKEFKDYTAPLLRGNPSVKALSWVPKIMLDEKQAFEAKAKNELNSDFEINQRNRINEIFPALERPFYFPIHYIEPIEENGNILGYDLYSSGARKAAINRVINSGKIHLTSRVKINQDTIGYSVLGLIPVFHANKTVAENTEINNLKGIISAIFKAEEIIAKAFVNKQDTGITMVIYDISNNKREYIYGNETLLKESNLVQISTFVIADREWEINFIVSPEFIHIKNSKSIFFIGAIISFLLFLILLLPFIKEEKNRILSQKLKKEQSEREKTEHSLSEIEEKAKELERRFSEILKSVNLVSLILDTNGNIEFCNDYLLKITGHTEDEIIGKSWFDIFIPDEISEKVRRVFAEAVTDQNLVSSMENEIVAKNGDRLRISWNNTSLKNIEGKIIGIASLGEDITERKKAEEVNKKLNKELEQKVELRTKDLQTKISEIERMNKHFIGRELRMKELKDKIKDLEQKLKNRSNL